MEGWKEWASMAAQQELYYGRQFTPDELVAQVAAVTAKQVQEFAREFFARGKLNLAAVGPFKETDFLPILEKAFPNQ